MKSPSGSLLTKNLSKANEFNSCFTNVCSSLANTNNSSALVPSTQPVNHIYRITPTLQSFTVNKELLSNCFKHYIKVGKACGPHNIAGKEVQIWVMSSLITFLVLSKRALMIAHFHHNGKQHRFTAFIKREILKTGNYCPISLLSMPVQVSYWKVLHTFE